MTLASGSSLHSYRIRTVPKKPWLRTPHIHFHRCLLQKTLQARPKGIYSLPQ